MLVNFSPHGVYVDGIHQPIGTPPVPIGNKTRIQPPGGFHFHFLTPYVNDKYTLASRVDNLHNLNGPQAPIASYLAKVLVSAKNRPMGKQELTQGVSHWHAAFRADSNLLGAVGVTLEANRCFERNLEGLWALRSEIWIEVLGGSFEVMTSRSLQQKILGDGGMSMHVARVTPTNFQVLFRP